MHINLLSESMLGHWDISTSVSQCEYQFGQRLVYVQHPKGKPHGLFVEKAQESIALAWSDIENAIYFAEQHSRKLLPVFWVAHDASGKPGARFDVYSIHYDMDDPRPVYMIGVSHDFDFEYASFAEDDFWNESPITLALPEPPENFWISLRHLGANHFEIAT
jgi:hypothetical protein